MSKPLPKIEYVGLSKTNTLVAPDLSTCNLDSLKISPHYIKEQLDRYVIGQDYAKKVLAVAAFNRHIRMELDQNDKTKDIVSKSNILMIGPTGVGKTELIRALSKILDAPLCIIDITAYTSAGYVGKSIEEIPKLIQQASQDFVSNNLDISGFYSTKRDLSHIACKNAIVYLDEIDKIRLERASGRDVAGRRVQEELLKLLEGDSSTSTIDLSNVLWICGGSFPDLLEEKCSTVKNTMGFHSKLNKVSFSDKDKLLKEVTTEDLVKFGMLPEFIGRLPFITTLNHLNVNDLLRIIEEPENSILKQIKLLFSSYGCEVEFEKKALEYIAEQALEKGTGARSLRGMFDKALLDIQYDLPSLEASKRKYLKITKSMIKSILGNK